MNCEIVLWKAAHHRSCLSARQKLGYSNEESGLIDKRVSEGVLRICSIELSIFRARSRLAFFVGGDTRQRQQKQQKQKREREGSGRTQHTWLITVLAQLKCWISLKEFFVLFRRHSLLSVCLLSLPFLLCVRAPFFYFPFFLVLCEGEGQSR